MIWISCCKTAIAKTGSLLQFIITHKREKFEHRNYLSVLHIFTLLVYISGLPLSNTFVSQPPGPGIPRASEMCAPGGLQEASACAGMMDAGRSARSPRIFRQGVAALLFFF